MEYVLQGFREGFRIGFAHERQTCTPAKRNMKSALDNQQVVDQYLTKEVELGRVVGPIVPESLSGI